jgi:phage-related protein
VPRRETYWAPGTQQELRSYIKRVRRLIGRGIEVAQWGQTDTHAVTHRAAYYVTKDPDGPVAILDVFVKKSKSGATTPAAVIDRIKSRLKFVKEIEHE